MRKLFVFLTIFIIAVSCKHPSNSGADKIRIATSIFPIYDIARNIAGDRVNVFFVVPVGANPHTYEPNPSVVKKLQDVDLFIGVFSDFDGWVEEFLRGSTEVRYLREKRGKENPHIWLSVKRAKGIAEKIADYLINADKENADYYKKNLNHYLKKLDRVDNGISALFKGVKNRKFIQWHPAWNYLADDYGLEITGTIQSGHGDTPSVRKFKNIVDTAKRDNIRVVVIGLKLQSRAADALIEEIDGIEVRLDSIGNPDIKERSSYILLIHYNAKVLSEALSR